MQALRVMWPYLSEPKQQQAHNVAERSGIRLPAIVRRGDGRVRGYRDESLTQAMILPLE